jgi:hypothetical protein
MGRLRASLARSAIDRELHTHLDRAGRAVRAALQVCQQAARRREADSTPYRQRLRRLARAERLLADIGYLDGSAPDEVDLKQEARALLSWLEGRERMAGAARPSRRGREYQDRLRAVLGFLGADSSATEEEEPKVQQPKPEPEQVEGEGVLWQRALELARQQGEADNDAYVQTIFLRLLRGDS